MSSEEYLFDGSDDSPAESGQNFESQGQEETDQIEVEARYKISPLTLTVFKKRHDQGVFRTFQLQRTYPKNDEGSDFGYTDGLRPRDLRKAARLFEKAADDAEGFEKQLEKQRGGR